MRIVVQRVQEASVTVDRIPVATIKKGVALLVGVGRGDTESDAVTLASKTANLRIFADNSGQMSCSLLEVKGKALVVPNFTVYGDCRKGRRPSFANAAPPEEANMLFESFCTALESEEICVARGVFGAHMLVQMKNDGPVTLLLDSRKEF